MDSRLIVAAIALALALALTPALRALARRLGLVDRPNARSSHEAAVPRAGGAAIALAAAAALALAAADHPPNDPSAHKEDMASRHATGVNVGFADGSARTVSSAIAQAVWQALATRDGGEPQAYLD